MQKDEESCRETLFLSARRKRLRKKKKKKKEEEEFDSSQREFKFIVFCLRIEPLDDLENLK